MQSADISKIMNRKVKKRKVLEQTLQSDFYNNWNLKINGF